MFTLQGFNQKYLLLAYSVLTNIGFVAVITYYIVNWGKNKLEISFICKKKIFKVP